MSHLKIKLDIKIIRSHFLIVHSCSGNLTHFLLQVFIKKKTLNKLRKHCTKRQNM